MQLTCTDITAWRASQFRRALRSHGMSATDRDLMRLHAFDGAVRRSTMELIEAIELTLRGRMDTLCTIRFGANWHLVTDAFLTGSDPAALTGRFRDALDRSIDPAARRLWTERRLDRVPFGALSEHLSLGTLSRLAGILEPRVARELADSFRLPAPTLRTTLQHITHVRNCCAHHSRIWGTVFGVPTPKYRSPPDLVERLERSAPRSPYRSILLAMHMASNGARASDHDVVDWLTRPEHRDLLPGLGVLG